jgi:hypothetical protein
LSFLFTLFWRIELWVAAAVKQVADADGSHADIAELTGLQVASVATRLSGLRKRMREAGHADLVPNFRRGGGGGRKLDTDAIASIFAG